MDNVSDRIAHNEIQKKLFRSNILTLVTLLCAITGFTTGLLLKRTGISEETIRYIDIPGKLILHGYGMLLVPVIFCGIILGINTLRHEGSKKVVFLTLLFFGLMMMVTSIFSCFLARWVRLGHHVTGDLPKDDFDNTTDDTEVVINSLVDFFENAVPENIVRATFLHKITVRHESHSDDDNGTLIYKTTTDYMYEPNYVGVMVFCLIFGGAMASLGNKVSTLYMIFEEMNAALMRILQVLMKILPIGLFFWLCCQGLRTTSLIDMFQTYGFYLSVFLGVELGYQFLILPLLYLIIVRKNPIRFHIALCPLLLMAFGSASSAATFPLSLRIMEERLKCPSCVSRFVIPLGSLVNKPGSTLATPLTVFFIAGMQGVDVGIVKTIILAFTNVLLQMAFPGIPGSGLNTLWFLFFVGIYKPYVIGLVMAVDWLLDRVITVNNTIGDCYVAAFVEKLCEKSIASQRRSRRIYGRSFIIETASLESIDVDSSGSYSSEEAVTIGRARSVY